MLTSTLAIGSLAAFAPTALTPPSSCRQPGLRLSAPVLSGALATGAAIGLCAARAADGARLASRAAHADEAAFRRYGASLHGMSAAVLYAGWRGGAAAVPPVALLGGAAAFSSAVPGFARLKGPKVLEALSVISLCVLGRLAQTGGDVAEMLPRVSHTPPKHPRQAGARLDQKLSLRPSLFSASSGLSLGALPFADAFTAAALIYGGNGLQWLLLPRYSASLYRFEAEIGPAATAAVRACGGTLLASGAYMQLLRRRGHAAGLAASAGLAAALSLARAVGALRAARAAAARQGCGLDYAPSIGRAAAAAAASAVIALGATR